jgi:hypothetical protein
MFATKSAKLATIVIASTLATAAAGSAYADTGWEQNHPRRDQVNDRLENQSRRINQEYREGEITRGQARTLHREDHQIRREERYMAAQNGGHITRTEQRVLNRQENRVSRRIGR